MPVLTRSSGPRGVRFYDEGEQIMFVHVLDGSTRVGPRVATPEDMVEFATEWRAYERNAPDDFPGRPIVTFSDPSGGKPHEAAAQEVRDAKRKYVRRA